MLQERNHVLRGRSFRSDLTEPVEGFPLEFDWSNVSLFIEVRSTRVLMKPVRYYCYYSYPHSGRISIEPYFAVRILDAHCRASSSSLHSSKKYPPNCSCVLAKGPSVIKVLPSRTHKVVFRLWMITLRYDKQMEISSSSQLEFKRLSLPREAISFGMSVIPVQPNQPEYKRLPKTQ